MANKKFKVTIRIEKELTRIVHAKNERQAEKEIRRRISSKPVKISTRDFEEFPSVIELTP